MVNQEVDKAVSVEVARELAGQTIEMTCPVCRGRKWTEEGDPEVGHAPFDCNNCDGTGTVTRSY